MASAPPTLMQACWNAYIDFNVVVVQTIMRESWLVLLQLVDWVCIIWLHLLGAETNIPQDALFLNPIAPVVSIPSARRGQDRSKLSVSSGLKTAKSIGMRLVKAPYVATLSSSSGGGISHPNSGGGARPVSAGASNGAAFPPGLLEHVMLTLLNVIAEVGESLKRRSFRRAAAQLSRLLPWVLFSSSAVSERFDVRSVKTIIEDNGHPYEAIRTFTCTGTAHLRSVAERRGLGPEGVEDDAVIHDGAAGGVALTMDRIPNRDSSTVVFFQHGVMDSSFGWVSCGPSGSLGFLAHAAGLDVFLGNFRGVSSSYAPHATARAPDGAMAWSAAARPLSDAPRYSDADRNEGASQQAHQAADSVESSLLYFKRACITSSSSSPTQRGSKASQKRSGGVAREDSAADRARLWYVVPDPSVGMCERQDRRAEGDGRGVQDGTHCDALRKYWDYTPDQLANEDLRTMIATVVQIKRAEGIENPQIVLVAHSLGAAASLAYVAVCAKAAEPSFVAQVVLLAPAGYHPKVPTFCRLTGPPLKWLGDFMGITHCRVAEFPWVQIVLSRLMNDVMGHRGARALFVYFMNTMLLGGPIATSPFQHTQNIVYNVCGAGVSFPTFKYFWRSHTTAQFGPADYGKEINERVFGQRYPPSYFDWYRHIDTPIHIVLGGGDTLIPPVCTQHHARVLRTFGREVTVRVFESLGHIDLTMGMSAKVNTHVLSVVVYWAQHGVRAGSFQDVVTGKPQRRSSLESRRVDGLTDLRGSGEGHAGAGSPSGGDLVAAGLGDVPESSSGEDKKEKASRKG